MCFNSWGCKESDTTERLNWTELENECLSLPTVSLAILQVDQVVKIIHEESACLYAVEKDAENKLLSWWCIDTFSFFFFSFKTCHHWIESLELILGHESTFSPDSWLFWLKHLSFLLTFAPFTFNQWVADLEFDNNG